MHFHVFGHWYYVQDHRKWHLRWSCHETLWGPLEFQSQRSGVGPLKISEDPWNFKGKGPEDSWILFSCFNPVKSSTVSNWNGVECGLFCFFLTLVVYPRVQSWVQLHSLPSSTVPLNNQEPRALVCWWSENCKSPSSHSSNQDWIGCTGPWYLDRRTTTSNVRWCRSVSRKTDI